MFGWHYPCPHPGQGWPLLGREMYLRGNKTMHNISAIHIQPRVKRLPTCKLGMQNLVIHYSENIISHNTLLHIFVCWWFGSARIPGIIIHSIDLVFLLRSSSSTRRINMYWFNLWLTASDVSPAHQHWYAVWLALILQAVFSSMVSHKLFNICDFQCVNFMLGVPMFLIEWWHCADALSCNPNLTVQPVSPAYWLRLFLATLI